MNRRHLLATAVLAAFAGCSADTEPTTASPDAPPPPGAKLIALKLPEMT